MVKMQIAFFIKITEKCARACIYEKFFVTLQPIYVRIRKRI